jgi:transposase InsO family protein
MVLQGTSVVVARQIVAAEMQAENCKGANPRSLQRWEAAVKGYEKQHWAAILMPAYVGRQAEAEIPDLAWECFSADYLRNEKPTASSCYERTKRICDAQGIDIPSLKTFQRRIERLDRAAVIYRREGSEALARTYPAQERNRSYLHAMHSVNADGHKFDVFVKWPDGQTISRPIMVGIQDLYSGKIVGYRVAETESSSLVRLAIHDMAERYGVPNAIYLDNGKAFASKDITGGAATRNRFKIRDEDPVGVLIAMGVDIHWTTPYHGQAKPIERAWRDLADRVAKHPAFAGAYTGNNPMAKPENYQSRAIPLAEFINVLNVEIRAHNARTGRRSKVCNGRSFDEAFAESYARHPIRKATTEQLRNLLLASKVVKAHRGDGSVHFAGNRYWSDAMSAWAGQRVQLRVDPDNLHSDIFVYSLSGDAIGVAHYISGEGFGDQDAAREYARGKRQHLRAKKDLARAEQRMSLAKLASQLPAPPPEELPEARVVASMSWPKDSRKARRVMVVEPIQRTGTDGMAINDAEMDSEVDMSSIYRSMSAAVDKATRWDYGDDEA